MSSRKPRLVRPVSHHAIDLRGDHGPLSATAAECEPCTHDALGDSLSMLPAIGVGSVDEIDALFAGCVHDVVCNTLGRIRSKIHRTEAQTTDFETRATKVHVFHDL